MILSRELGHQSMKEYFLHVFKLRNLGQGNYTSWLIGKYLCYENYIIVL